MRRDIDSLFGTSHFQNVTYLPDILSKLNYEQVYFGGANKAFAGKADFLYAHQFDVVNGFGDLKDKYENYASWGLYDVSLFNEAFIIFFILKNGVKLVDFYSVDSRSVEMKFSKENCAALGGENELFAVKSVSGRRARSGIAR